MATLTKSQYRLLTIASLLGIFQGLAWLIMSLICIIMHLDSDGTRPDISLDNASYMEIVKFNLFYQFLDARTTNTGFIITPDVFTIFMWIYFFSNVIWAILSILLARTINKIDGNPLNTLRAWGVITCFISLIDLLLVILLGVDFNDCITRVFTGVDSVRYETERNCTDFIIPVLIIAARGFVLWIINIIFAYVVYRILRIIQSGKNLNLKLLSTERQLPRATLQGQTSSSNLYSQYQGSGYVQPSEISWPNVPQRPSSYDPNRSAPSSPYYANPQQPSFARY